MPSAAAPAAHHRAAGRVAVVMLYPLLWLVGASFKSNTEIFTEVGFWPSRLDFGSYAKAGRPAPNTPSPPTS
jgi:oligogalacturonide transport system permease protein